MATERLNVILQMTAGQYKREAKEAATATGRISQSAGEAGTATGKLGSSMSGLAGIARVAVAGAATAAVVGFAKDSVRAATDLNESINAVQVTFGDAAEGVLAIGENAADSFGLAQSEFNSFAVQFSNFGKTIAAGTGTEVDEVIGELTGRIADFASVMNIDVPEAAEKFQSGLAGQVEPLRAFGIDVSAAAVNQKALSLGLADTTAELTEQDKILARYKLIMEQTDQTAGDFKNTQGDLANATRTLNANLEDSKAKIGEAVLPVLGDMAAALADVLGFLNDINVQLPASGEQFSLLEGGAKAVLGIFGTFSLVKDVVTGFFGSTEESATDAGVAMSESADQVLRMKGVTADLDKQDLDGVQGEFKETELTVLDAVEAIQAYDTAFRRLTDPVFKAIDDQRRLADAFETYNNVLDDSESTTQDVENAMFDLLGAQQDVNTSSANLPTSLKRSEDAFLELGRQVGLSDDELAQLESRINSLDGRQARLDFQVFFTAAGSPIARDVAAAQSGRIQSQGTVRFHGGGVVQGPPGSEQVAVLKAGETVLPTQDPNFALTVPLSSQGPTNTINIGTVYGFDDFAAKVRDAGITIDRLG